MELNRDKIIAVVVWFNPSSTEVDAISLYNSDVRRVVVVDNSSHDNSSLLTSIPNADYLPLLENRGIAEALNIGCKRAAELGAAWILTMDQDSRWDIHSIPQYLEEITQYPEFDKVGVFSPYHDCDGTPERHHHNGRFEQKQIVMCSGNLLRTEAWHKAGGFRNDFFIDSVDDEICCHIRQLGYQVVCAHHVLLNHHLGDALLRTRILRHQYIPHQPWRYFYIGRNMHRMLRLYPDMQGYYRKSMRKYIKRLLLYDNDRKFQKLSNLLRGWFTK